MRRMIGTGTAFVLVMWAVTAAYAQAPAGGMSIMPGQSVGAYHIGQDISVLVSALGPINEADDIPGSQYTGYYWPLKRIGAIADKQTNKIVALIVQLDENYRTDKGVSAGTELDALRAAYGQEDSVDSTDDDDTLVYDNLGIAFAVDKAGALSSRVSAIWVFGSGQYKSIFDQQ
jgi:hypothetical protein